jgi:hypothetical protein
VFAASAEVDEEVPRMLVLFDNQIVMEEWHERQRHQNRPQTAVLAERSASFAANIACEGGYDPG